MQLTVEIAAAGAPPEGAAVVVQVRDAAVADEASVLLGEARATWSGVVARVQVDAELTGAPIVFVHVDCDGDGEISKGDYITMQSYPVGTAGAVRVEVKKV
ncbi:MAG TPA: hypothetical protein VEK11_21120 [Thermoanaerobaculia bacterium]|nr:hypothetical protein [Thermoanaerobaculia bacterium]